MKCVGAMGIQCGNWEENRAACVRCGWELNEGLRRQQLPMVKGEDGLLRKIVRRES